MKIKKIMRINVGGDWKCSLCGHQRWSHYAFIMDDGKIIYVCKDCVEKSEFTDSIDYIKKLAGSKLTTQKS